MCQTMEAARFKEAQASIIAQIREGFAKAIREFLATPEAGSVISPPLQSVANASLDRPGTAVGIIRHYAGELSMRLSSENRQRYWSIIDAGNFLEDATGSRWNHMTQEKRALCLKWAAEELDSLSLHVNKSLQS